MPEEGVAEGSVFLGWAQATYFASRNPTASTFTDSGGRAWTVEKGHADADEENYGLFDGPDLVARLCILSPANAELSCPTQFWWIGRIEVVDRYQARGIAASLIAAVVTERGMPLASDLDQTQGGAALWRKLIRTSPRPIELHGAAGLIGSVQLLNGVYQPDPWRARATRLVLLP